MAEFQAQSSSRLDALDNVLSRANEASERESMVASDTYRESKDMSDRYSARVDKWMNDIYAGRPRQSGPIVKAFGSGKPTGPASNEDTSDLVSCPGCGGLLKQSRSSSRTCPDCEHELPPREKSSDTSKKKASGSPPVAIPTMSVDEAVESSSMSGGVKLAIIAGVIVLFLLIGSLVAVLVIRFT